MGRLLFANLIDLFSSLGVLAAVVAVLHTVERAASRFVAHRLGWNAVLATGWIGVPLHELSHLLVARVFGHRIVAWKLFDPDPTTGTLGYVRHAYRRRSVWQLSGGFFIGVAPLVSGAVALLLVVTWMAPAVRSFALLHRGPVSLLTDPTVLVRGHVWVGLAKDQMQAMLACGRAVWHARTIWLPLQIYLCVAIASHTAPSPRDLASMLPGLAWVVVFGLVLVLALAVAGCTTVLTTVLAPTACLLVAMVVVCQGLYVAAIAVVGALF